MTAARGLAAILAADVAGYLLLMGVDEEGTLERLKALRRELADVRKRANRRNGDDDPKITEFAVQDTADCGSPDAAPCGRARVVSIHRRDFAADSL